MSVGMSASPVKSRTMSSVCVLSPKTDLTTSSAAADACGENAVKQQAHTINSAAKTAVFLRLRFLFDAGSRPGFKIGVLVFMVVILLPGLLYEL